MSAVYTRRGKPDCCTVKPQLHLRTQEVFSLPCASASSVFVDPSSSDVRSRSCVLFFLMIRSMIRLIERGRERCRAGRVAFYPHLMLLRSPSVQTGCCSTPHRVPDPTDVFESCSVPPRVSSVSVCWQLSAFAMIPCYPLFHLAPVALVPHRSIYVHTPTFTAGKSSAAYCCTGSSFYRCWCPQVLRVDTALLLLLF